MNVNRTGLKIWTASLLTALVPTLALYAGSSTSPDYIIAIDTDGRLGTLNSSARFKEQVADLDAGSDALLALRPVTFRYKPEYDPDGLPQFGLVAEEVEKVCPELVARDADGKVYTVRYEAVNAMLLNEFLKSHRKAERQEATIADQQKEIERQATRLDEVESTLRKVNERLNHGKPSPATP